MEAKIVDRRVPARRFVKLLDVVEHVDPRRVTRSVDLTPDKFDPQQREAFYRDVVPDIATTHRAGDVFFVNQRLGLRMPPLRAALRDVGLVPLYAKQLERGRFIWLSPAVGFVVTASAQLTYFLEGIDWHHPRHT